MTCDLCQGSCTPRGSYTVLGRFEAHIVQCENCGYACATNPDWLAEAYSTPMTSVDIGPVDRCIGTSRVTKILLDLFHDCAGRNLDFGGGYGLFVRRMRDLGYNFF